MEELGSVYEGTNDFTSRTFSKMIFDKWNIRTNEHGPVAYCYYGDFGAKPRGTLNKEDYVSVWVHKPKNRRELDKKVFWLKSLPDGFKDIVAF